MWYPHLQIIMIFTYIHGSLISHVWYITAQYTLTGTIIGLLLRHGHTHPGSKTAYLPLLMESKVTTSLLTFCIHSWLSGQGLQHERTQVLCLLAKDLNMYSLLSREPTILANLPNFCHAANFSIQRYIFQICIPKLCSITQYQGWELATTGKEKEKKFGVCCISHLDNAHLAAFDWRSNFSFPQLKNPQYTFKTPEIKWLFLANFSSAGI